MEDKSFDVVIIGGGPAGLTAALYTARAGNKTAVIEKLVTGGALNLTSDIANFPGFTEISGFELGAKMHEQAQRAGVEIIFGEIEKVDFDKKTVACCMAETSYKALIIASGAGPRKLGCPGEEKFFTNGVHTCALCDGAFYKEKNVVVIGGGNSAVEEAIYMAAVAKSVTVVNVTDKFNAQQVLIDKLEKLKNIKIFHNHKVVKILGDKKLCGIEIQNNKTGKDKTIEADGVFIAIGRVPNTELFKDKLELTKDGYITVDNKMRASVAGVFAAGDVIDKQIRQVITACADGAVAAINASEYIKSIT